VTILTPKCQFKPVSVPCPAYNEKVKKGFYPRMTPRLTFNAFLMWYKSHLTIIRPLVNCFEINKGINA
jgi:hypothetical protein